MTSLYKEANHLSYFFLRINSVWMSALFSKNACRGRIGCVECCVCVVCKCCRLSCFVCWAWGDVCRSGTTASMISHNKLAIKEQYRFLWFNKSCLCLLSTDSVLSVQGWYDDTYTWSPIKCYKKWYSNLALLNLIYSEPVWGNALFYVPSPVWHVNQCLKWFFGQEQGTT